MENESVAFRQYSAEPTYSGPPRHVLIVDDDPFFRGLLKVMLQQTGIPLALIWEAENSGAASAICRNEAVDLVFCDLNLHALRSRNGLEIVRELRAKLPYAPIYMVTADNSVELIQRVRDAGATGHILKPVNLRTLKRLVISRLAAEWSKLTAHEVCQ